MLCAAKRIKGSGVTKSAPTDPRTEAELLRRIEERAKLLKKHTPT